MTVILLQVLFMIMETTNEPSPIKVSVQEGREFAFFTNQRHPGNRIGYRFFEHLPIIYGSVPTAVFDEPLNDQADVRNQEPFKPQSDTMSHTMFINTVGWTPQKWTFNLTPIEDGIDLYWVVETTDTGLPQYYGVQQCFRLGGVSNRPWRREIAETPAFSEYDLWDITEKDSVTKTSLTYILRSNQWQPLPATQQTVGARTPLGVSIDSEISGGHISSMTAVGPYKAQMLDPIDLGLITRIDKNKTWVCGIYWQNTSHVTAHHPADCLHCIVNIGGIPPNSRRVLHGKIYWFQGSLQDLLIHWKHDFGVK